MYPPFVRSIASLPPLAPVPYLSTLQKLASIMSHSKSGGRSHQGEPVLNIHKTALINCLLSLAMPPIVLVGQVDGLKPFLHGIGYVLAMRG